MMPSTPYHWKTTTFAVAVSLSLAPLPEVSAQPVISVEDAGDGGGMAARGNANNDNDYPDFGSIPSVHTCPHWAKQYLVRAWNGRKVTWANAAKLCYNEYNRGSNRAQLATIRTREDLRKFISTIDELKWIIRDETPEAYQYAWIGGYYVRDAATTTGTQFEWLGTPRQRIPKATQGDCCGASSVANWEYGEPTAHWPMPHHPQQQCVETNSVGKWRDNRCGNPSGGTPKFFICEVRS